MISAYLYCHWESRKMIFFCCERKEKINTRRRLRQKQTLANRNPEEILTFGQYFDSYFMYTLIWICLLQPKHFTSIRLYYLFDWDRWKNGFDQRVLKPHWLFINANVFSKSISPVRLFIMNGWTWSICFSRFLSTFTLLSITKWVPIANLRVNNIGRLFIPSVQQIRYK